MNSPEQILANMGAVELPIKSNDNASYNKQVPKNQNFKATPFKFPVEANIPRRKWLYGYHLIRKFVSVTIAPGGLGKSSQVLTEAVAMATGKPILGHQVGKPLKVWVWNLEDPRDELCRRLAGIAKHYNISNEDIGDRLFIDSGREQELRLGIAGKDGPVIQQQVMDNLIIELKDNKVDVLIIDPFISSHELDENSNPAMDTVAKAWGRIADKTKTAISIVHHTRKQAADSDVSADSARGAKALVDAARDVRCFTRMTEQEGEAAEVENHRAYYRVYSDKANLAPPADKSEWYKIETNDLQNGDSVGVITRWQWPDSLEGVTKQHLHEIQKEIDGSEWRFDTRAKDLWVGHLIADVIGIDTHKEAGKNKVKLLLEQYMKSGALIKVKKTTSKDRNKSWIMEVGEWCA